MISYIKYFFFFLLLMILQKFVLDNIFIFQDTRPVIFFYFILIMPVMPRAWQMVLAFCIGLFYDLFTESPGVNAAACVLLAYIRDPLVKLIKGEADEEFYSAHINYLGSGRFFTFITFCAVVYHLIVVFLSAFTFTEFGNSLVRAGLGSLLSVALIYMLDIVFFYRKAEAV